MTFGLTSSRLCLGLEVTPVLRLVLSNWLLRCITLSTRQPTDWFGTSGIRRMRTRFSPVVANCYRRLSRMEVSAAFCVEMSLSTTRSALDTLQRRFLLHWEWRSHGIEREKI